MAVNVRASIRRALKQLQTQRTRIDREISALEEALAALEGVSRHAAEKASEKKSPRARRKMSAKARKAASTRMKAFWANKKAQTGK